MHINCTRYTGHYNKRFTYLHANSLIFLLYCVNYFYFIFRLLKMSNPEVSYTMNETNTHSFFVCVVITVVVAILIIKIITRRTRNVHFEIENQNKGKGKLFLIVFFFKFYIVCLELHYTYRSLNPSLKHFARKVIFIRVLSIVSAIHRKIP